MVNGLILVARKGLGDNFGIGANKSYTILEIAKMLDMPYVMKPGKKGNRLDGGLKTAKTKKLGWSSRYNLKDYIKKNIE